MILTILWLELDSLAFHFCYFLFQFLLNEYFLLVCCLFEVWKWYCQLWWRLLRFKQNSCLLLHWFLWSLCLHQILLQPYWRSLYVQKASHRYYPCSWSLWQTCLCCSDVRSWVGLLYFQVVHWEAKKNKMRNILHRIWVVVILIGLCDNVLRNAVSCHNIHLYVHNIHHDNSSLLWFDGCISEFWESVCWIIGRKRSSRSSWIW